LLFERDGVDLALQYSGDVDDMSVFTLVAGGLGIV